MLSNQQLHQFVLGHVRVLELIHHDMEVTFLVGTEQIISLSEELHGLHQQVVEVHSIVAAQEFLVTYIDPGRNLLSVGTCEEAIRADQLIFGLGDNAVKGCWSISFIIQI